MKFKDLDRNVYTINLSGYMVKGEEKRPRSNLHVLARKILKEFFPTAPILEEVVAKLKRGKNAYLDFFIPSSNIVVEVHGQQHYKFNTMFHASAQDFIAQKKRDAELIDWCEINNLTYIELKYDESEEEWRQKINMR